MMEGKVIIAMKGHPGTGKSTLANSLASALKFPLIDKDDVRDSTFPLQIQSKLLNDFSYDVVFQIASTQLRLGLSVIIDSPLSRRSHLDRLLHLASSTGSRLFIVECKPSDVAEWRRRLELRGSDSERSSSSWHKPSTWRDLERLLDGYDGCTEYDVGDVPRLLVDTTSSSRGLGDLVSDVMEFVAASRSHGGGCVRAGA